MSIAPPAEPRAEVTQPDASQEAHVSRVPYLPGLDGMRAIAVVAVMIYHANASWLPGGFLGVEMFFVISGYLITLLLIAERERSYTTSLKHFWLRRARRLLPALYVMMALVVVGTAVTQPEALGQLRGDVIAGLFYVSNWYQIVVGLGYTAAADFAPLRHLWSLAVEEQFYIVWPLVMILLLSRYGTRRISAASRWLFLAAVVVTVVGALVYPTGPIGDPEVTPDAYWWIGDHPISKLDTLYLGTIFRSSGLLLGAALAMVWRPYAVVRGPLRRKGHLFDVLAVVALIAFLWMNWNLHLVTPGGTADGRLFEGGLFATSVATVVIIAAVAHRGASANRLLGVPFLVWIGTRSYGLYLYHWPIYQFIRESAGKPLTFAQFVFAIALTVVLTELSYRLIEMPVRRGRLRTMIRRARAGRPRRARVTVVGGVAVASVLALGLGVTLATADLRQNEVATALARGEEFTTDLVADAEAGVPTPVEFETEAPIDADTAGDALSASTLVPSAVSTAPVTTTPVTSTPSSTAPEAGADRGTRTETTTAGRGGANGRNSSPRTTAAPASTAAPRTTAAPPPVPVQRGVVNDLSTLEPLKVPKTQKGLPLVALGDSVMLGAAEELQALGFAVDAVVSRQMISFLPHMELLRNNGTYGSAVVVHLGTNGGFSQETLDQMLGYLADVPVVLLLTGKADRGWVAGNNAMLRAVPETHRNVTVLDWEVLSQQCGGGCFYSDGIHLTPDGQRFYADLVARTLSLG